MSEHASIHAALAAAQGEFPAIVKNRTAKVKSKRTGIEFEYSYCTLDAILDAVRPALSKNGLALRHVVTKDHTTIVEAVLSFGAGEELRSGPLPIPNFDGDMQALGSGLTYARRYTATALLGICAEEDDDAQQTPTNAGNPYRERKPPKSEAPAKTAEDLIAACASAAELASLLTKIVGKHPVRENAERWKALGKAAKERMEASDWPDAHKAVVSAVLDGVRNQLMAPATQAPAAEADAPTAEPTKGDPAKAPSLERLAAWIGQQETPEAILSAVVSLEGSAKFADLRAHPERMLEAIDAVDARIAAICEAGDWKNDDFDEAVQRMMALIKQYQTELQSQEAFDKK